MVLAACLPGSYRCRAVATLVNLRKYMFLYVFIRNHETTFPSVGEKIAARMGRERSRASECPALGLYSHPKSHFGCSLFKECENGTFSPYTNVSHWYKRRVNKIGKPKKPLQDNDFWVFGHLTILKQTLNLYIVVTKFIF